MKFPIPTLAVTFVLCLGACHAYPAPGHAPADKQASTPSPAGSADSSNAKSVQSDRAALLNGKLTKGMAYSEFRKVVLDNGWQPKPDAQCMANVVGGNYEKLCSEHPALGSCKVCAELPELSACSGDGHCLMQFEHSGSDNALQVGTYGEVRTWNAPRRDSRLSITGWEFRKSAAH